MACKKVWHEEIQSWVFEDPDEDKSIPDGADPEDFGIKMLDAAPHGRVLTYPLNVLEGRPLHAKSCETK